MIQVNKEKWETLNSNQKNILPFFTTTMLYGTRHGNSSITKLIREKVRKEEK